MASLDVITLSGQFLTHCSVTRGRSTNTVRAYRQDLEEFARFYGRQPDEPPLEPALILAYVRFLRDERSLKPATLRRRVACLKVFCRWLERTGGVGSPFHGLELSLRQPVRLPRALNRQDLVAITAAAAGHPSQATHARASRSTSAVEDISRTTGLAIRLMTATGIRVGELTRIALADVATDGRAIRVIGKGSRERTVYVGNRRLADDVSRYVRDRLRGATPSDPLLVNARGAPLSPATMRLRLRKLSIALQISPRITPHRFRHTAATMLLEEGVDIRFVQRLLGHSSISTTEIYTHVTDASLRAAIERADTIGKLPP